VVSDIPTFGLGWGVAKPPVSLRVEKYFCCICFLFLFAIVLVVVVAAVAAAAVIVAVVVAVVSEVA